MLPVPSAIHAAGFMAVVHSVSPTGLWRFYCGGLEGAVMRNVPKQVSGSGVDRLEAENNTQQLPNGPFWVK